MNSPATDTPQVLIVDDEEMIRVLLTRALQVDNIAATCASNYKDALAALKTSIPDLLIVDKNLPDGSGLDVIDASRTMGFDGEVILITGYSDTESAIQAVNLGVFRYIRKPFDLDALKVDVRRALETGRLRRELDNRTNELEKTNEDLRNALTKIQESEVRRAQSERLATIGSLAAGVAHEINNPLSLLAMTIPFATTELGAIFRDDAINAEPQKAAQSLAKVHKLLQPTQEALELLLVLSSDLHSLGRKDPPTPQPTRILDVVNSALRIVRHQIKHKAQIDIQIPDDLSINGQPNRLVQVFINLFTNAGRAIPKGNPDDNRISVSGYLDDTAVVVEVQDSGVGIPKENLDNIFARFFTWSTSGEYEGSGIGLSIVKEVVSEHDGQINVVSEPGSGTAFYLRFPVLPMRKSHPPLSAVTPTEDTQYVRTRRTILFVDGDTENLNDYQKSFGQMHTVLTAHSTDEATEIIGEQADIIDVVVCHMMGQQDAIPTLYADTIKHLAELKDRFVFIYASAESLPATTDEHKHLHLQAPVRPATLLATIYRIPPRRPSHDI
ncbi:MAG: ATP-binding protein [Proteobacteria bacterium]|nr:ATP-binding protein [Pseudomonadota bacterium]